MFNNIQSINLQYNQSIYYSINQSTIQSINLLFNQSINLQYNQSIYYSINQSIITWSAIAKQAFFCGTVWNFQSCSESWTKPEASGTLMLKLTSSEPPASIRRTDTPGSSDSRLARTQPADPAPTKS